MPYAGFSSTTTLSGAETAAIELAVKVSGQQAVADLQSQLGDMNQKIAAATTTFEIYSRGANHSAEETQNFINNVKELIAQQKHLTDSVKAAENAHRNVSNQFKNTGQAALQLSYAVDDLQYGFSAIVNNAPQIALALGGGPGIAGAMGVAFVAANILGKELPNVGGVLKTLARDFDLIRTPVVNASTSLEGYQEVIQAISDRPFKFEADFASIRQITREVEAATRAVSEFKALNAGRTESQQAAHKALTEGIVESGGGDHNLEDAMIEIQKKKGTYGVGSKFQYDIAFQQSIADQAADAIPGLGSLSPAGLAAQAVKAHAESQVAFYRDKMEQEARDKIAETVSLRGGDRDVRQISGIAADEANADVFARHGIDPLRLRAGAENAMSGAVREREKAKVDAARAKKEAEAQEAKSRLEQEAQRNADQAKGKAAREEHQATVTRLKVQDEFKKAMDQGEKQVGREETAAERAATTARNKGITEKQREMREATRGPANWGMYARNFQALTGANNAQAVGAGKKVAKEVEGGAEPEVAMEQTIAAMAVLLRKQNMVALRNAAAWEQMNGVIGQATMMVNAVEQQQRRATTVTRTNNVH